VSSAPEVRSSARPTRAIVALGANLADRLGMLRAARDELARHPALALVASSSVYETDPVGPPDQPRYLNAAVAVETRLSPRELLDELLAVEARLGRTRGAERWTARTIDLDLVLFGELVASDGDLSVPHPRFRERAFVLLPAAEIAPDMRDPVTGERLESLLRACPGRSDAVRVGPLETP
jgi:2-amino-4-hydroxy-6-hydroxymethyldihydropteridine diphosphokinase